MLWERDDDDLRAYLLQTVDNVLNDAKKRLLRQLFVELENHDGGINSLR